MKGVTVPLIAEGKTKKIFDDLHHEGCVLVESTNNTTAGDGERAAQIEGKGEFANRTTCNIFEYLRSKGVFTHYWQQINETTFRADKLRMIPIEVVMRRRAVGSYLKRNPEVVEGHVFGDVVVELFWKDDSLHDPIMEWDEERKVFNLLDPSTADKRKVGRVKTDLLGLDIAPREIREQLISSGSAIFCHLERALDSLGVVLIDLKVEFGVDRWGQIVLGDVIDPDSWRAWIDGDPAKAIDKQGFRDAPEITNDVMMSIYNKYRYAAELTDKLPR